ncbi:MAG: 5'/3'-nucleotidase SurE [Anaerolineae bacterium]
MELPRILVANDDGIEAPGLVALARELRAIGKIVVVAPERNWSAVGHTKTMHKPLRAGEVSFPDGITAYETSGSPSDCVALALLGLVREPIDLVVSGINDGANLGTDVLYSGTFAAAAEAVVNGVSAFAISLDSGSHRNYGPAARFATELARRLLAFRSERPWLLNVNAPDLPNGEIRGVQVTRLGQRLYQDALVERLDPRGRPYYWIGGERPAGIAEEGTDVGAVASGLISVTPMLLDLTDQSRLEVLRQWRLAVPEAPPVAGPICPVPEQ